MGRYSALLAPQFADLAGVGSRQRVLDVGCGPGALTSELVERVGASAVAAVDPSEQFAAAVRERHPGVDVQRAAAEELPFAEGEFDAAGRREVEEPALPVRLEPATFEEWWEPFTLGGGPAGSYVAALDSAQQVELRERCRQRLPAPFTLSARAWAARGFV